MLTFTEFPQRFFGVEFEKYSEMAQVPSIQVQVRVKVQVLSCKYKYKYIGLPLAMQMKLNKIHVSWLS